ncbi:unnamed protein product, partial [Boreogadus saida]
ERTEESQELNDDSEQRLHETSLVSSSFQPTEHAGDRNSKTARNNCCLMSWMRPKVALSTLQWIMQPVYSGGFSQCPYLDIGHSV